VGGQPVPAHPAGSHEERNTPALSTIPENLATAAMAISFELPPFVLMSEAVVG